MLELWNEIFSWQLWWLTEQQIHYHNLWQQQQQCWLLAQTRVGSMGFVVDNTNELETTAWRMVERTWYAEPFNWQQYILAYNRATRLSVHHQDMLDRQRDTEDRLIAAGVR